MRWTERQRAMLREMGIRLWLPEDAPRAATSAVAATVARAVSEPPAVAVVERATSAPPSTSRAGAPAAEAVGSTAPAPQRVPGLAAADWLVVGDVLDAADPQQLLENILRAIGVGLVAPTRE